MADVMKLLPELHGQELAFVDQLIKDLSEDQANTFAMAYRVQRRDPQTVLLLTLVGLIAVSGIQRFYLGQIGMGIVYFLTGGFCMIGTIIDTINHQKMTFQYNQQKAQEVVSMVQR